MEAFLQIFYILMALYGWSQWQVKETELLVTNWNLSNHLKSLMLIFVLTIISGYPLAKYTNASLPYFDAFTTWGAVVATYMVAKKLLENWIYWFVIDFVSVFLFISRELYITAFLFTGYLIIIVFGYLAWKRSMLQKKGVNIN